MHVGARGQCCRPRRRGAHLSACIASGRACTTQQRRAACPQVPAAIVRGWAVRERQMGHPEPRHASRCMGRVVPPWGWRGPDHCLGSTHNSVRYTIPRPLASALRCPLPLPSPLSWTAMDLLGGYGSGSDSEPGSPSGAGDQGRVTLIANSAPEPQAAPAGPRQNADPTRLLTSLPAPSGSKVSAAPAAAAACCRPPSCVCCLIPSALAAQPPSLMLPVLRTYTPAPLLACLSPLSGRRRCSQACPSPPPRSGWRCSSACPSATTRPM